MGPTCSFRIVCNRILFCSESPPIALFICNVSLNNVAVVPVILRFSAFFICVSKYLKTFVSFSLDAFINAVSFGISNDFKSSNVCIGKASNILLLDIILFNLNSSVSIG